MTKKLIVFDWNGTLLSDTVPSWKAANICLKYYGAAPITLARYRQTFHFPVIHFYRLNNVDVDTVLARKDAAYSVFQGAYERFAQHARTRRGTRALLQWLGDQTIDAMILSNYVTPKIEQQLARLGIRSFFKHVSGHEDGMHILQNTSKQQRLADYLKAHSYEPKNVVIIGDSMEEPEIARHLGVTSIGITDGYINTARLREAKPDYIIDALPAMIDILKKKWFF